MMQGRATPAGQPHRTDEKTLIWDCADKANPTSSNSIAAGHNKR